MLLNDSKSSWKIVHSGNFQDSHLFPVLFLMKINSLPDSINSNLRLFVDDAKI